MQDLEQAVKKFIKIRRKILRTFHYCASFAFELPNMIITFDGTMFVDKLKWKGLASELIEGLQAMNILDAFLNAFDITKRAIDDNIAHLLDIACILDLSIELSDGIYLQDGNIEDKRENIMHLNVAIGLFPYSIQLLKKQTSRIILHAPYVPMLTPSYMNAIKSSLPKIRREILRKEAV